MKIILLVLVACVAAWLLNSMWLMLAIGDMHRNWWHAIPLMGYKAALPIGFTLSAFLAAGSASSFRNRK